MDDVDASVTLESLVVHVGIRGNLTDAAVLQAVDSIAFSEDVRLEVERRLEVRDVPRERLLQDRVARGRVVVAHAVAVPERS